MKFLILCGHGYDGSNYDPGAGGCGYTEANETIRYGNLIANKLRSFAEVDVFEGNMYHKLFFGSGSYDFTNYDYVLELHLNASVNSAAYGTEIYVTSAEEYITVEQQIMKKLSKYFTLRDNDSVFDGVKVCDYGVIREIKNQDKVSAALLELCFISNQDDMNTYENNIDSICNDIADGIAEGFELKENGDVVEVPEDAPVIELDQVLNPGDKFTVPGVFKVDEVSAERDAVCNYELSDGAPNEDNWIDAAICDETDSSGTVIGDQVLANGEYFKINGTFTVVCNDPEYDAVYAQIGRRKTWLKAGPCVEVE